MNPKSSCASKDRFKILASEEDEDKGEDDNDEESIQHGRKRAVHNEPTNYTIGDAIKIAKQ